FRVLIMRLADRAGGVDPHRRGRAADLDVAPRIPWLDRWPRQVIPHFDDIRLRLLLVQSESWLARPFLDDEVPSRFVVGGGFAAYHLRFREIESEEVNIGIDLGLIERSPNLTMREIVFFLVRKRCEHSLVIRWGGAPCRMMRIDHGGGI